MVHGIRKAGWELGPSPNPAVMITLLTPHRALDELGT
jgi:hypothetical protein